MRRPAVDLSRCILCDVCHAACPEVFVLTDAGYIDVMDMDEYPETDVDEAIKNCPTGCIAWE